MDIKIFKGEAYVTYTKNLKDRDAPYEVKIYNLKGELHDKIRSDCYKTAREYFKAFCKIAKTF